MYARERTGKEEKRIKTEKDRNREGERDRKKEKERLRKGERELRSKNEVITHFTSCCHFVSFRKVPTLADSRLNEIPKKSIKYTIHHKFSAFHSI